MALNLVLLLFGSLMAAIWGIAHLLPTASVVKGFGDISKDNRRIITMEWLAEGMTLIFVGGLSFTLLLTGLYQSPAGILVLRSLVALLLALAVLTALTGARTAVLPIKICPLVQTLAATLILLGIPA